MSYLWHFVSFSESQFDRLWGSNDSVIEEQVVEAVTWDDWGNLEVIERLARRMVKQGIDYGSVPEDEWCELDTIISLLFGPEGLEEELAVEGVSMDGLHPSYTLELLERVTNAGLQYELLWVLEGGRRIGVSAPSFCEYVVLAPDEVVMLRDELQDALQKIQEWSTPETPELIRQELLTGLQQVEQTGRSVFGTLS